LNPFPSKSRRTNYTNEIIGKFTDFEGKEVTVAGRLMSWRKQGGLAFGHVQDESGRIQLFLKKQNVQSASKEKGNIGFTEFNLLDLGDIVEASGKVMRTERGEISVMVDTLSIIAKAFRPLPDQWSGLKDREIILRKRYLDSILEKPSQERFASITRMIAAIRTFLNGKGFMEFTTPVIQPQYGGGTAKPFGVPSAMVTLDPKAAPQPFDFGPMRLRSSALPQRAMEPERKQVPNRRAMA